MTPISATVGHDFGELIVFSDVWHDSSFLLSLDGRSIHVEVERFTRKKYDCVNPVLVFCELYPELVDRFSTIIVQDGTLVADYFREVARLRSHGKGWSDEAVVRLRMPIAHEWLIKTHGMPAYRNDTASVERFTRHLFDPGVRLYFAGHHACHAANAFHSSGHANALAVTLDGGGWDLAGRARGSKLIASSNGLLDAAEFAHTQVYGSFYRYVDRRAYLVHEINDTSLGWAWSRVVTDLLDMKDGEEGTIMATAALGDPLRFRSQFAEPHVWGIATYDLSESDKLALREWTLRLRAEILCDQDRYDVAAALQAETELRVRGMLETHLQPGDEHLVLSGGTTLNCQMTGKLRGWFPQLKSVFIPPAPHDSGLTIGAAQLFHYEVCGKARPSGHSPFAIGEIYSRDDVIVASQQLGVELERADDEEFLRLVEEGRFVGLFQGAAESGRRALGNRSIIAHPGFPGLKEELNRRVKHRQWYRPFAPMVLAEHVHDWFDCQPGFSSPYMSFAVPVRAEVIDRVRNVVHIDGSARIQTVHHDLTPQLHRQLTRWFERSGIPILLNTSFNDREPIVETPLDALQTFSRTAIDAVYFADAGLLARKSRLIITAETSFH